MVARREFTRYSCRSEKDASAGGSHWKIRRVKKTTSLILQAIFWSKYSYFECFQPEDKIRFMHTNEICPLVYREDICLQTLLLLFKYANHKNKRSFVSTANEALVCILMTIGDVNNIFPIDQAPIQSMK